MSIKWPGHEDKMKLQNEVHRLQTEVHRLRTMFKDQICTGCDGHGSPRPTREICSRCGGSGKEPAS